MNARLTNFQLKGCELNVIVGRSISLCIEFHMCKTADFLPIQVILFDDFRIDVDFLTVYDYVDFSVNSFYFLILFFS
jgi:hypothetical protein